MKTHTFAQRLQEAMNLRGLKQIDIVNKIKIDKTLLNKYLKGISEPKQDKLTALADILDVNEVWLMGYDVPTEKKEMTKFEEFLVGIKYEKIEELVENDKKYNFNLVNSLDFFDIVFLFSSKMMSVITDSYENCEKIHKLSLNVKNEFAYDNQNITLNDELLNMIDNYDYYTLEEKRNKLLYFINKIYTEDELLDRLCENEAFKITDKKTNQEINDISKRKEMIKLFINEYLKLIDNYFNQNK